ncbi:MAG: nucleotide pyrophosphohydrolase [Pseudomonadota bacterium]
MPSSRSDIAELTAALIRFRDERDWAQFHNPKDLAAALSIEAGELLECFLWKVHGEADEARVREELADVLAYALLLAEHYKLDVKQVVLEKIAKNAQKYPVHQARGSAKKYTEL